MDRIRKAYKTIEEMVPKGILLQPIFLLVVFFGITALGIPKSVMYLLDLLNVSIFLFSLKKILRFTQDSTRGVFCYVAFLGLYSFLLFLINHQSLLYYLWGLRNTFRFFLFFFLCICWIKVKDIWMILNIFEVFLFLNVIVCSWQYWIGHMPFDNICGLFGVTTLGSGYMNVLLVIVTATVVTRYLRKMISTGHFLATIGGGVYIAIISELKAYYFELALITTPALLLYMLEKRKLKRRFFIALSACVAGMAVLAAITVALKPEYWQGFFSPQGIWKEITRESGYSNQGDLNRLTAISYIFKNIFHGGIKSLFGFGLGNCDYSAFEILTTPFYRMYESLHYVWIHVAFLFLELGFIGLLLYMGFFVYVGINAWKKRMNGAEEEKALNQTVLIISVCCIFFIFYNICLRTEAAYMVFFVLASGFISEHRKGVCCNDT